MQTALLVAGNSGIYLSHGSSGVGGSWGCKMPWRESARCAASALLRVPLAGTGGGCGDAGDPAAPAATGGWVPSQTATRRLGGCCGLIHSWIPGVATLGMKFASLQPGSGRHPNTGVAFKLQAAFGTCFKVIVLTQGARVERGSWLSGGGEGTWGGGAECAAAGNPQHPVAVSVPNTVPVILFSPIFFFFFL